MVLFSFLYEGALLFSLPFPINVCTGTEKRKIIKVRILLAFFFLIDTDRSFFIQSIFLEIASEKLNRDVLFV